MSYEYEPLDYDFNPEQEFMDTIYAASEHDMDSLLRQSYDYSFNQYFSFIEDQFMVDDLYNYIDRNISEHGFSPFECDAQEAYDAMDPDYYYENPLSEESPYGGSGPLLCHEQGARYAQDAINYIKDSGFEEQYAKDRFENLYGDYFEKYDRMSEDRIREDVELGIDKMTEEFGDITKTAGSTLGKLGITSGSAQDMWSDVKDSYDLNIDIEKLKEKIAIKKLIDNYVSGLYSSAVDIAQQDVGFMVPGYDEDE